MKYSLLAKFELARRESAEVHSRFSNLLTCSNIWALMDATTTIHESADLFENLVRSEVHAVALLVTLAVNRKVQILNPN